jgi:hypothetical protein
MPFRRGDSIGIRDGLGNTPHGSRVPRQVTARTPQAARSNRGVPREFNNLRTVRLAAAGASDRVVDQCRYAPALSLS